ncbi:unnamed protein product [Mytilus coruscus]|uniref:Uncharacterized protein n=1 Tax=Mytilus coruscus TaxID=42192 RepID=A0A6J7ZXW0_MYTCO|nr:unnamed protein product [Mytilus coruscus]
MIQRHIGQMIGYSLLLHKKWLVGKTYNYKDCFKDHMNRMFVYIAMIVLVVDKASTSGTWKLTNFTVTFGKDVYLMCLLDEVECNISKQEPDPRSWTGGPHYKMLCMNGDCRNSSKYKMITQSASLNFELLIHNFSESDLDHPYTCSCGFYDFTKNLSVEPKQVMSLPTISKTIKDQNDFNNDNMEIEIMLHKVNPVPNCSALFKGRFINDANVAVMKWYKYHNDVKVIYNFPEDDVGCEGRLQILCTLVYRNVSIFDEYIDICQEKEETMQTMILPAIGCVVFVMILLICIYLAKKYDVLFGRRCWTNGKTKQSAYTNQDHLVIADKNKQENETSAILNV